MKRRIEVSSGETRTIMGAENSRENTAHVVVFHRLFSGGSEGGDFKMDCHVHRSSQGVKRISKNHDFYLQSTITSSMQDNIYFIQESFYKNVDKIRLENKRGLSIKSFQSAG